MWQTNHQKTTPTYWIHNQSNRCKQKPYNHENEILRMIHRYISTSRFDHQWASAFSKGCEKSRVNILPQHPLRSWSPSVFTTRCPPTSLRVSLNYDAFPGKIMARNRGASGARSPAAPWRPGRNDVCSCCEEAKKGGGARKKRRGRWLESRRRW